MRTILMFTILLGVLVFDSCFNVKRVNKNRPNIILIIADDLGWGDVGYHGSEIMTPNLDGLAKEGIELNRFYVAPMCSPTRAGLITGKYPSRYGLRNNVIRPWLDFGLDTLEETLPDILADEGYQDRALVGKWHLGHSRLAYHPLNRGYTYFYGHLNGAIDYFSFRREGERDWHENYLPSSDTGYTTDLIGKKVRQLIRTYTKNDGPFFLQVAFNAPHSPLQATREYLDKYDFDPSQPTFRPGRGHGNTKRQTYAAMVTHMDHEIGSMLQLIDSLGIGGNTIVLFMSDNGAELNHGGSSGKLRGGKLTEWEGGVRVPALLKWQGKVKSGKTTDQVIGYVDVLPTILALIGVEPHKDSMWDGKDMSHALLNGVTKNRTLFLGNGTLIHNNFKLIEGGEKIGLTRIKIEKDHLFDLTNDEIESNNIISSDTSMYRLMRKMIKPYNDISNHIPAQNDERPEDFQAPEKWLIKKAKE